MSSTRRLPSSAKSPVLWGALLVGLVRALVALSRTDELELELYAGSLAWALLEGMPLDTTQLPIIVHLRGSVLFGLLAVPLFAVWGPCLGAVKAIAVGWSMATAAVLIGLARRFLGARAAWSTAVVVALLPPAYQMVDVLALGSHGETALFIYGALWLALIAADRTPRALALGAVCGLGVFFSMQFLVALPAVLLAWALAHPAHWRRVLPVALPALLAVGAWAKWGAGALAPSLPIWWQTALLGALCLGLSRAKLREPFLDFLGMALLAAAPTSFVTRTTTLVTQGTAEHVRLDPGEVVARLSDVVLHELRPALLFEENGGAWAGWLFVGAALLALLSVLRPALRRDPLACFALVYPALWLLAMAVSDFVFNLRVVEDGMGSRYLMPPLLCVPLWAGLALREHGSKLGGLCVGALVLAGAAGLWPLLDPGYAWRQPTVRATEFAFFHGHFEQASGDDLEERLAWIDRVDPDWAAYRPLVHEVLRLPTETPTLETLRRDLELARQASAELAPALLLDLGFTAGKYGDRGPSLEQLSPLLAPLGAEERAWFLRGLGKGWLMPTLDARMRGEVVFEIELREEGERDPVARKEAVRGYRETTPIYAYTRLATLPAGPRRFALEGMAFTIGARIGPYQPALTSLLGPAHRMPPEARERFFEALGEGYRVRFIEADYAAPEPGVLRVEAWLDEPALAAFHRGLRAPHDGL